MRAFIITPVCSHALTIRPLVVMDDKTIKLKQDGSRHSLCITLDGQRLYKLKPGEEVVIKTAPVSFQLIRLVDRSYFETLRKKFHWGGSLFNNSRSDSGSPRHGKSDT
jgi:NAD+ kinase